MQHLERGPQPPRRAGELQSIARARHHDVGQQQIDLRVAFEDRHRAVAVVGLQHLVVLIGQEEADDLAHIEIVFDQQNDRARRHA